MRGGDRDAGTAPAPGGADGPVLHHEELIGEGDPDRWLYVLHGIYGTGRNWRTVARRLTRRRDEWGALLVDLRMHGQSRGFEPPHTLSACVDDLRRLRRVTGRRVGALLGHSFGGKVVLQALAEEAFSGPAAGHGRRQAWVVDSIPEAREPGGGAVRMLEVVRGLPGPFDSRDEAVDAIAGHGFPRPVARWMSVNLERTDGEFRWARDWSAMEELLDDFFDRDLWPVVEHPPAGWEIRFLKAEDSAAVDEETSDRIREAGRRNGRVELHALPGGHFLNVENPGEVVDLLQRELP